MQQMLPGERLARFEAHWSTYDECGEVIKIAWNRTLHHGGGFDNLNKKLQCCMVSLKKWTKNKDPINDNWLQG